MDSSKLVTSGKPASVNAPDPEVSATSGRRRFSAAYKARIVRAANACRAEAGEEPAASQS